MSFSRATAIFIFFMSVELATMTGLNSRAICINTQMGNDDIGNGNQKECRFKNRAWITSMKWSKSMPVQLDLHFSFLGTIGLRPWAYGGRQKAKPSTSSRYLWPQPMLRRSYLKRDRQIQYIFKLIIPTFGFLNGIFILTMFESYTTIRHDSTARLAC